MIAIKGRKVIPLLTADGKLSPQKEEEVNGHSKVLAGLILQGGCALGLAFTTITAARAKGATGPGTFLTSG